MNLTLIGMPASGKSVVGVLLAKRLRMTFLDTDLVIQEQEGALLKDIITEKGLEEFQRIEEQVNASVETENTVIAPGGSVIYEEKAMRHFQEISTLVYLQVELEDWKKRIGDPKTRGVVISEGQTLEELYRERVQLYETYAQVTVREQGKDIGDVVDELIAYFAPENLELKEK